jgi:hypothetical protein
MPNDPPHGVGDRIAATEARRRQAETYNEIMEAYVWRRCDWAAFPESHRRILEAHVVDGADALQIARKLRLTYALCKDTLARHRRLAGVPKTR